MNPSILRGGLLAGLVVFGVLFSLSVFIVRQTEHALVLRFGQTRDAYSQPCLHFKVPLIDNVVTIDKRILDLENPSQEVIASDQKRLVVDAFARYRIKDPLRFYQSIGSIQAANIQLTTLLNAALRRVLPAYDRIGRLLSEHDAITLYLAAVDPQAGTARARSFMRSAEMGEDPATGSSVGPLCAHVAARTGAQRLVVEQGIEMGRPSRLVCTWEDGRVRVGGDVVVLVTGTLRLP